MAEQSRIAYHLGYNRGYDAGFDQGYDAGFRQGYDDGRTGGGFAGTSIIIPTYNQLSYLQQCVASIRRETPEAHEIIIVDNGSTDGTPDWLSQERRRLRYHVNDENRGFAGAVNQGLRMARGATLVILNNDTLVTPSWLSNLLACALSGPKVGLVGPVTNYISGEQQIDPGYRDDLAEMRRFAAAHNVRDPSRWRKVSRIIGFCLMMRRDVFQRLGYFDEGFEIGNCEDDDYGLRARLLGYDLVVAGDTFIHHFGSVSMKALEDRFDAVYQRNLDYYARKWEDPHSLLAEIGDTEALRRSVDLYPSHVLVRGPGPRPFWVENGIRYGLDVLPPDESPVRLSVPDLKGWPLAGQLSPDQLEWKRASLRPGTLLPLPEGTCVTAGEGGIFQIERGRLRRFVSQWAVECWGLAGRIRQVDKSALAHLAQGLPIIAPPILKANHL